MTGMQIECDPKHNKRKFTGNRYLPEILSQQKQFCPLVRPSPKLHLEVNAVNRYIGISPLLLLVVKEVNNEVNTLTFCCPDA